MSMVAEDISGMTNAAVEDVLDQVVMVGGDVLSTAGVAFNNDVDKHALETFASVVDSGADTETRRKARELTSSIANSSSIFVDPSAIDEDMAGTAVSINEITSTGEKLSELNSGLSDCWQAPEAGTFMASLSDLIGVVDGYLTSNENISNFASHAARLYSDAQELDTIAVSTQSTK